MVGMLSHGMSGVGRPRGVLRRALVALAIVVLVGPGALVSPAGRAAVPHLRAAVLDSECEAALGNVVRNCGFEDYGFSPRFPFWVSGGDDWGFSQDPDPVHTGFRSATQPGRGSLSQTMPVVPGVEYRLRFYLHGGNPLAGETGAPWSYLNATIGNGDEASVAYSTGDVWIEGWDETTYTFVAEAATVTLTFDLHAAWVWYLDDVSVVPVNRSWYVGDTCVAPDYSSGTSGSASQMIADAVAGAGEGDLIVLCDPRYDLTTGIAIHQMTLFIAGTAAMSGVTRVQRAAGAGAFTLITASEYGSTVHLDRLHLAGGSAASAGRGIHSNGAVAVSGSIFSDLSAGSGDGGAIAAETVSVLDSRFTNDRARNGGAINALGDVDVAGSTFLSDVAPTGSGGAIHTGNGVVAIRNSTFADNTAGTGGAIWAAQGVSVVLSRFSRNRATDPDSGVGGAVYSENEQVQAAFSSFDANAAARGGAIWADDVDVEFSTFSGNRALGAAQGGPDGGGAIDAVSVSVNASTLDGNTAVTNGGAIWSVDAIVRNSTFVGNSAGGTAGAIQAEASMEILDATFSGNTAPSSGALRTGTGALAIDRSIVSGSTRSAQCGTSSGTIVTTGSLATDTSCGALATSRGLALGALADNGGPTKTVGLLTGSVARDAVTCGKLSTDQRDWPRPYPLEGKCDVGAYEYQPFLVLAYAGSTTVSAGSSFTLSATTKSDTGTILASKPVRFTLCNGRTYDATTGSRGTVSVTAVADVPAGLCSIVVSFAGDATYLPMSKMATLTVGALATKLSYTGSTSATAGSDTYSLAASLVAGRVPVVGVQLLFTVATPTPTTYSAWTTGAGGALVQDPVMALPKGKWVVTVTFAGNGTYLPATATGTITVR